jgi:hypothetical protein
VPLVDEGERSVSPPEEAKPGQGENGVEGQKDSAAQVTGERKEQWGLRKAAKM